MFYEEIEDVYKLYYTYSFNNQWIADEIVSRRYYYDYYDYDYNEDGDTKETEPVDPP